MMTLFDTMVVSNSDELKRNGTVEYILRDELKQRLFTCATTQPSAKWLYTVVMELDTMTVDRCRFAELVDAWVHQLGPGTLQAELSRGHNSPPSVPQSERPAAADSPLSLQSKQCKLEMLSIFDRVLVSETTFAPRMELKLKLLESGSEHPNIMQLSDAVQGLPSPVVDRSKFAGLVDIWLQHMDRQTCSGASAKLAGGQKPMENASRKEALKQLNS